MLKTAEERITQSRVRLLLTKPFFGTLATRLKLVDASDRIPTAGTDGRTFYFNREFVDNLTDPMLDFLIGHEVLHCVYDHMVGRGDRNPIIYNCAADYVINMELIKQRIGEPITKEKLSGGEMCLDWKYDGWNSYEVYDDLLENAEKIMATLDVHMDGDSGDDGKEGEGKGAFGQMTAEERKQLADEIKQAAISAAQSAGQDVPDQIKRIINELTAPKMDWCDVLRVNIESSLKNDFTFMRPSKRSGEVIFPGMNKDQELNIAVAVDTSGSISENMLRDFLSEVQGIMDQYNSYKITVMQFDTNVYGVEEFTHDNGKTMAEYEVQGGGGTDFDAVFNYMAENNIEPDQLVMFTDGYPWNSWGNPDYCDTLFVVHSDPKHTRVAPFGVTIYYDN
jgi:predicted metal-dependent peptidase